jgi:cytochrome c biogenesis protein CcmG/thiol:disulfide interchange protein DsbE
VSGPLPGRRWPAGPLAVLTLVATAACTAEAKATPSPFSDCSTITSSAAGNDLPDLSIPCFTGGDPVALKDLRGPAVINLWASWCGPCRAELPIMQSLADRAKGKLTVLGVDIGDRRDAGASFAGDKNVSMPTLFDEDRKFLNALAGTALPMTVFLDPDGRKYVYLFPLTEKTIAEQVHAHTGVTVTP